MLPHGTRNRPDRSMYGFQHAADGRWKHGASLLVKELLEMVFPPLRLPVLRPGGRLAGRYRMLHLLGQGRHGQVVLAVDETSGQRVAIKAGRSRALQREGQILAQLSHPLIPHLLHQQKAAGRHLLVMEAIDGASLSHLLGQLGRGPQRQLLALVVADHLLGVLAYLHQRQIAHGDITPANVLLGRDGYCRLIDFSAALPLHHQAATGCLYGTPGYLAPECYEHVPPAPSGDLFGLGATLHHLLLGEAPFWIGQVRRLPQYAHSQLGALGPLVMPLLHPDPQQRLTLGEAREQLHRLRILRHPAMTQPMGSTDTPPLVAAAVHVWFHASSSPVFGQDLKRWSRG
ncbi:MAG: serine/threonine protein kinase [Ktedonobacteraceae bacterium]|nr:serine/threonine protein kinase [Ktedonobacteraceae bacterium]